MNNMTSKKVVLIAGGGKVYTDIAARFVRSERSLEEIVGSEYDKRIVENILDRGHRAALEFDWFVFGVEGYSRVCEVQLVRKRHASFLIKSGRAELNGKRKFSMSYPRRIDGFVANIHVPDRVLMKPGAGLGGGATMIPLYVNAKTLCNMIEQWYEQGLEAGLPEEDLRYMKPQATTFKGIIGMNAHALLDFFAVRCCKNAQEEIRDMANKMLAICKASAPDLFRDAGPQCRTLGYCPENSAQNPLCSGMIKKTDALLILQGVNRDAR